MLYICKPRGSNKTTCLCYLSDATKAPIVTHSEVQKKYIIDLAESLFLDIPDPITVNELREKKSKINYSEVLIDNAEDIIEKALIEYLSVRPLAVTITNKK